jgi:hypothetical protein
MEIKKLLDELKDPFSDDFPLDKYPIFYPDGLSERGKIFVDMISLFLRYNDELTQIFIEGNSLDKLLAYLNEVKFDTDKYPFGSDELKVIYKFENEYKKLNDRLKNLSDKNIDKIDYETFYRNKIELYNINKKSISNSILAFERQFIETDINEKNKQQYSDALKILYEHEIFILDLIASIETLISQYDAKNNTNILSLITFKINAENGNYNMNNLKNFIKNFINNKTISSAFN